LNIAAMKPRTFLVLFATLALLLSICQMNERMQEGPTESASQGAGQSQQVRGHYPDFTKKQCQAQESN
jgi:hypothetical protein